MQKYTILKRILVDKAIAKLQISDASIKNLTFYSDKAQQGL